MTYNTGGMYQPPRYNAYTPQLGPIWVNNEQEVLNYPMGPNAIIPFWNKNEQIVYWRTTDNMGNSNITILEYTIKYSESNNDVDKFSEYVSKSDFDDFCSRIEKQINRINSNINNPNNSNYRRKENI